MNELDKLIEKLIKEKGGTKQRYLHLLNSIANHETGGTMSPMQNQMGGGPGRGKYQFEMGEKRGGITAARRLKRYYKNNDISVPKWLNSATAQNSLDATTLTSQQQDLLFLGNMREHDRADLSKVISGEESVPEFWANYHWSGPKRQRQARLKSFNSTYEEMEAAPVPPKEKEPTLPTTKEIFQSEWGEIKNITKNPQQFFTDLKDRFTEGETAGSAKIRKRIEDYNTYQKKQDSIKQFALGGPTDPPTKDKAAAVATGRDFTTKWFSHPETRKRYRANMNEMAGTADDNLGQDNIKFRDALTGIEGANVRFKKAAGDTKANYNEAFNTMDFYGNVNPGTATHEFTHAAGDLDTDLSKYAMKKYGLLRSLRGKHPGLSTNEAIQKEFNTSSNTGTQSRLKHAEYMGQNGELYPRFMEMRQFLNVTPGQEIDDVMIEKLMKNSKTSQSAKYFKSGQLKNILNTIAQNGVQQPAQNVAAYGGLLGQAAYGGMFSTYGTGGTHESNPNGGVKLGSSASVEQGETSFNFKDMGKYIFSNRITSNGKIKN